jgi:hypothetical protein
VFENRVLRTIFETKREKVAGGWRSLHNEELHSLYASTNVITLMKSRKMKWTWHVALIREIRRLYKIWSENVKGRDNSEKPGVDGSNG